MMSATDRRSAWWAGLVVVAALMAACSKPPEVPPAEPPTLDVTSWTDKSELFMEYPPLAAGQTVRFAVHLTRLADFSALNAGRPRIEMTPEAGGSVTTLPGSEPLRPGAFRVEGALPPGGRLYSDGGTYSDWWRLDVKGTVSEGRRRRRVSRDDASAAANYFMTRRIADGQSGCSGEKLSIKGRMDKRACLL